MGIWSTSLILTLVITKKKVVSLQVPVFSITFFRKHLIMEFGNDL